MAEAVGVAASIITLVDVAKKVSKYVRTAKDAPREREDLLSDLTTTIGVLVNIQDYVEDDDHDDGFRQTTALLTARSGPLDQLMSSLNWLEKRLQAKRGLREIVKSLTWPFDKEEVNDMCTRLRAMQGLLNLALSSDHVLVYSEVDRIN